MSLTTPYINNCQLKLNIGPSTVNLINDIIPICLNVYFNSITNLEVVSGSFTPVNNTLNIAPSIPTGLAPNFIFLFTDGPVNLTLNSGATVLMLQNPVTKLFFNPMTINNTYLISDIILDGTTTALVPMLQNTQVNYTLVMGQGIIN